MKLLKIMSTFSERIENARYSKQAKWQVIDIITKHVEAMILNSETTKSFHMSTDYLYIILSYFTEIKSFFEKNNVNIGYTIDYDNILIIHIYDVSSFVDYFDEIK